MRLVRLVGSTALLPLALVTAAACGGSEKATSGPADTSPSPSATASPTVSASPTADPKVGEALDAATRTWDDASGLAYGQAAVASDDLDISAITAAARAERDAYYAFDGALRKIDFPASAATARNAVLTDIGTVISGLDKVASAADAKGASDAFFDSFTNFTEREKNLAALREAVGLPASMPPPETTAVYQDDTFTEKPGGWDFFDEATRTVTGGSKYSITLNGAFSYRSAPTPTPAVTLPTDVSVEATFTTPKAKKSQYGLSCPGANGNAYEGVVSADGAYALGYAVNARLEHYLVNTEPGTVELKPAQNTLRLDCRKISGGTFITLYVNGKRVDSVGWTQPTAPAPRQPAVVFNTFESDSVAMSDWKVSSIDWGTTDGID